MRRPANRPTMDPSGRLMRRIGMTRRMATVTVLLALAVGGCGADGADGPASDRPAGSSAPTPSDVSVETVTVQQRGGIAGVERTWRVTSETPGSQRVFAAASDEAVRESGGDRAEEICCDVFTYTVSVSYSDGQTVRFSTTDGEQVDPAVQALLDAVLATDPAHPDSLR